MKSTQRQQKMIELLDENSSLSVEYCAGLFNVTPTTIRRDFNQLEQKKLVLRSRGLIVKRNNNSLDVATRSNINKREKQVLAKTALSLISPHDSIIMDSGSTTHALAEHMLKSDIDNLTIITNYVPIAVTLSSKNQVIMPGGLMQNSNMSLIGPETDEYFSNITADKLFFSPTGVRGSIGLTGASPFFISVKKNMIKAAKQVIAIIDSTKYENNSVNLFCSFKDVDILVTSKTKYNEKILEQIEAQGVKIILADMDEDD